MQKDLEDRFISSLKTVEDFSDASIKGITLDSFLMRPEIYEFIAKHVAKYDKIPPKATLESNFLDFKLADDVEDGEKDYLIEELRKSEVKRKARSVLDKGADILEEDADGGIDFILDKLARVRKNQSYCIGYIDKEAPSRLERIKERKKKVEEGGMIGIRTGLSFFDENLLGWIKGNLISLIGLTGKGKSWFAHYLACFSYLEGSRVLIISPEMTKEEVEDRVDVIMGSLMQYKFSHKGLLVGNVDEKKYKEYLDRFSKRKEFIVADADGDKPFTINSINHLVTLYEPDVVIVDGFLLIDIGSRDYSTMLNAAMDLKSIAQSKKLVMLVVSQGVVNTYELKGKESSKESEMTTYGGKALEQAANVHLKLWDDPDKPKVRKVAVSKVRTGEGFNKPQEISFDVDIGKIG
jgi:archaellum biogenesis ATPase FlaH